MDIEFDLKKSASNEAKHGVSFAVAEELDWDSALVTEDTRRDYGERRQKALVLLNDRLMHAVFVDRGEVRRMISLRKANAREVKAWNDAK